MKSRDRRSDRDWLSALAGAGRDEALTELRALLVAGLRRSLTGRAAIETGLLEDFAQDALLRILDRLDSFRGESRFTTWALAIAIRVAFSELRRRRWKDISLEEALEAIEWRPAGLVDGAGPLDARIMQSQILAVLERVLDENLSERQRRAILAEYVVEVPLEEVARRMGTNRNALYKLLHDGRRRLKSGMLKAGLTWEEVQRAFDL